MDKYFLWINNICSSPLVTLGSFLLALLGVILAFVFYIKGRRSKKPFYSLNSISIIRDFSSMVSDLEIKYQDEYVNNLTITKIVFWNGGNETIRNIDIASANPITIGIKDEFKILKADIIHKSHKDNLLELTEIKKNRSFDLSFDFLDEDQGGVIQVIHTGKSSKDIVVGGTIKGAGNPIFRNILSIPSIRMILPTSMNPFPLLIKNPRDFGYYIIAALILLTLVGISILSFSEEKVIGWIISLTYGILIIPFYIVFIKRKVPRSLQIFEGGFEIEESTNMANSADAKSRAAD